MAEPTIRLKQIRYGAEATLTAGRLDLTASGRVEGAPEKDDVTGDEITFREEEQANPEVLLATAHVSCYASALSSVLHNRGHHPERLVVRSVVTLDPPEREGSGYRISAVNLWVDGDVEGLDTETFDTLAEQAEHVCPISGGINEPVPITLHPSLG